MSDLGTLLRQAGRALVRRPLYAAVACLTVAAGIAASTASFVLVDAALLSPLPFREPERLVTPEIIGFQGYPISLSVPNYRDWSASTQLESSAAAAGWSVVLSGHGAARVLEVRQVLGDLFGTLGMTARYGRLFTAAETERGAAPVAVLGAKFFQELGGDPGIVGQPLVLDSVTYTVVGVLPPGAGYPSDEVNAYLPLGVLADLPWEERGSSFGMRLIARLAPDATLASAQADLDRITAALRAAEGQNEVATPRLEPLAEIFVGDLRGPFLLLFGAAALVVLLTVANVANLFLARGESRRDELAVRAALGAPRGDLLRLQLAEGAWIGGAGALLGFGGATVLVFVLRGWIAGEMPGIVADRLAAGGRAALFALLVAALVAATLGALPALTLARRTPASPLHGARTVSARGSSRFRATLVVGQLALGTLLAIGALKLATSLDRLREVDKGFDESGVVAARLAVPDGHFADTAAWRAFHLQLLERARALPGVRTASLTMLLPLGDRSWEQGLVPEGADLETTQPDSVLFNVVSPEHFDTFGVPLVRGRTFDSRDRDGAELAVVVDESLARRYWPGEDPLGRRVAFEYENPHAADSKPIFRTIVGVVKNVRHYELQSASRIQVYVPFEQTRGRGNYGMHVVARTDGATAPLVAALPRLVSELDPAVPTRDVTPLAAVVDGALTGPRLLSRTASTLGTIALLLAGVGVFAVASYGVAARRRELGLRQALGATPRELVGDVLRGGLRWCVVGAGLGAIAAAVAHRLAASMVWGVGAFEPTPYFAAVALLVGLSLAACALPALQAMRVAPAIVLRDEA